MDLQTECIESDPTVRYLTEHNHRGMPPSTVRFHPDKCVLPKFYLDHVDRIKNFDVRKEDTWIITFPKCGTTWMQEMVWLMKNNYDFQAAKEEKTYCRIPFLEYRYLQDPSKPLNPIGEASSIEGLNSLPSPRVIKSHLPVSLLPSKLWTVKPKIIYVYRNPKDAVTSYLHHYQMFSNYDGTKDSFVKAFLEEKVTYGSFWSNVLRFWEKRNEPNVLFTTFEDMKEDLKKVAQDVADFLETPIPSDVETELLAHLSFSSMSKNPAVNIGAIYDSSNSENKNLQFIRQGRSGTWSSNLSPRQVRQFDDWSHGAIEGTQFPHYW